MVIQAVLISELKVFTCFSNLVPIVFGIDEPSGFDIGPPSGLLLLTAFDHFAPKDLLQLIVWVSVLLVQGEDTLLRAGFSLGSVTVAGPCLKEEVVIQIGNVILLLLLFPLFLGLFLWFSPCWGCHRG